MKLVNPRGRSVDELSNQVNYGCSCSNGAGTYDGAYTGSYHTNTCICCCSYGYDNYYANYNIGLRN